MREDSRSTRNSYMLWSGDVLRNEDDDFSQWNCKTTTDVLDTYDKMVMNRKTYTVL